MQSRTGGGFKGWRHALFAAMLLVLLGVFLAGLTRGSQLLAPLQYLYIFFGLAILFWRFGVRHYTSTGS